MTLPMPRATLEPGELFAGEFRVIRPLAAGGMGAVYVVEQTSTGRERALKLLKPELVVDVKARKRFHLEARIGGLVASDHVVEVVDAGIEESTKTPWIAMELLEGEDLSDWAPARAPLPWETIDRIVGQLCHALGAAHRAGIVHRDLKPENVFIARSRRSDVELTVKVLDFGIAKWIDEARTSGSGTQSVGTPLWMAPEQADVGQSIGPATDVWALGLVVFWMLTDRYYWKAANVEDGSVRQVLVEMLAMELEPASQRARAVGAVAVLPAGFDAWFAACVDRDPGRRFVNAEAAYRALAPLLRADPNAPTAELPAARAIPRTLESRAVHAQTVPAPSVPAPSVPAPSVPAPSVPAPSVPAPSVPAPSVAAPSVPAPTTLEVQSAMASSASVPDSAARPGAHASDGARESHPPTLPTSRGGLWVSLLLASVALVGGGLAWLGGEPSEVMPARPDVPVAIPATDPPETSMSGAAELATFDAGGTTPVEAMQATPRPSAASAASEPSAPGPSPNPARASVRTAASTTERIASPTSPTPPTETASPTSPTPPTETASPTASPTSPTASPTSPTASPTSPTASPTSPTSPTASTGVTAPPVARLDRPLTLVNERPTTVRVTLRCGSVERSVEIPARGQTVERIPAETACDTSCADAAGTVVCQRVSATAARLRVR